MTPLLDLVRVLYEPGAVFTRVKERPAVLIPMVTLIVVSLILGFLALPFVKAGIAGVMAAQAQARGGQMPDAGTAAMIQIIATAIFLPIAILISGTLLWILASIFGLNASFVRLLSVSCYSTVLYLLQVGFGLIVLSMRGIESVTSPMDLQPAFGLDLLFPNLTGYVGALVKGVNIFSLWGVFVQGVGITKTHDTSPKTGYTIAGVAFLLFLLLFSLFALLQPQT